MKLRVNLRQKREDAKLSINEMARLTGLSPQQVVRLENGGSWFSRESLTEVCKALKCEPGDLLEIEEEELVSA
ncbi:MAG: helix-turn-helix domain-containing protein [Xenococcaceae cyanobacterium]